MSSLSTARCQRDDYDGAHARAATTREIAFLAVISRCPQPWLLARRAARSGTAGPPIDQQEPCSTRESTGRQQAPLAEKALLHAVVDNCRARQTIDAKSSRHARNSVTRQNFLFLNVHRNGWLTPPPSRPIETAVVIARKPRLSRRFTEHPRELPALVPLGGRAARRRARWGFDGPTRGVGLAFVRLRGYGRRCWLVL
jgi:hypothetical protein